jgi:serine protease
MLSVNPGLSADQIIGGLRASARPHAVSTVPGLAVCGDANPGRCLCTTATCGAGILDVEQALLFAANPGAYVNTRSADVLDTPELRAAAASGPDRPANVAPPPSSGGGGGGAVGAGWLLALALAAWALRRELSAAAPPRRRVRSPRRVRQR